MTSIRAHASCAGVAFVTLVCFALATSGCLSNEYVISRDELIRVASMPPEARGHVVRVSQQLGERRADEVDVAIPRYEDDEAFAPRGDVSVNVDVGNGSSGGSSRGPRGSSGGSRAAPSGGFRGAAVSSGFHGTPPGAGQAASAGGGFHGASGGGFHGVPAPKGGGGGGLNLGGGGGGGNGGDALLMLVVVAIVGAAIATVALAASEGARFEGHAELSPEQTIYLDDGAGPPHAVALGDLTIQEAMSADSAVVKDDEGFGLHRLDHAPLDREGGVFRFELGAGTFSLGGTRASGLASHIQAGFYPTQTLGVVFDFGIGTGTPDPCCVGVGLPVPTDTMTRLSFGLELQALPLALGPLHLGGFAGGGVATAGAGGAYESGPLASGGALLELDLTSHMALTARGGVSGAWLPSGFSPAGTLTGGLTIY